MRVEVEFFLAILNLLGLNHNEGLGGQLRALDVDEAGVRRVIAPLTLPRARMVVPFDHVFGGAKFSSSVAFKQFVIGSVERVKLVDLKFDA